MQRVDKKGEFCIIEVMKSANVKRRESELSAKQHAYVKNVTKGIPRHQSAVLAGYPDNDKVERAVEESVNVRTEIARIREETVKNTGITKEKVVEMFVEAGNMARVMSDPQGLIAAARELGKMLGFYAPEVKKTLHGVDQASLKKALEDMSDEDLMKLANSRTLLIEGTYENVSKD